MRDAVVENVGKGPVLLFGIVCALYLVASLDGDDGLRREPMTEHVL